MKQKGFTLIELLVVISIIAILSTVVFVALNPAGRFRDARNSRRFSDINNILTAIHECIVDNSGSVTACGLSEPTAQTQLGTAATGCDDDTCGAVAACLDLSTQLAPYLKSIPLDPSLGVGSSETHYSVTVDSNNIVTVDACDAENSTTIQVSR
jgi:prepilin-type N-terminal cleavage/methylation domain-containing protein